MSIACAGLLGAETGGIYTSSGVERTGVVYMDLHGSCACGSIKFSLQSKHPYPFNICYCSICRKTAGSGGYGINLGGDAASLKNTGEDALKTYQAQIANPDTGKPETSPAQRKFCGACGTPLWVWDPRWPELIHPFASAIDTELPVPKERTHLMLGSKASWVEASSGPNDLHFDKYPIESIADWHQRLGLES